MLTMLVTAMLFFPEAQFHELPSQYQLRAEDARIVTADGVALHGWFLPAEPQRAVMVMLHGNAGNISHRLFKVAPLVKAGMSVLMVDYRGFGQSQGKIKTGTDLYADGRAAMAWLKSAKHIDSQDVVLFGESIGSAPALHIATEMPVRGVILEAAFTRLIDLGKRHYPLLPRFLAKDFAYDNLANIAKITAPILIMHGTADAICPYDMGQALFDAANEPKQLFTVDGGTHNELPLQSGKDYFENLVNFSLRLQDSTHPVK